MFGIVKMKIVNKDIESGNMEEILMKMENRNASKKIEKWVII